MDLLLHPEIWVFGANSMGIMFGASAYNSGVRMESARIAVVGALLVAINGTMCLYWAAQVLT